MKFKPITSLPILLSVVLITSCSQNSKPQTDIMTTMVATNDTYINSDSDTESELNTVSKAEKGSDDVNAAIVPSDMVEYSMADYYTDWVDQNPDYIELTGSSADLSSSGAVVDGNIITIISAGIYVISGQLEDGQILVNLNNSGMVQLVLNGADINCSDNAPIYIKKADKAVISIQNGTENNITDGESYKQADSTKDEETNAAIYSKVDLTINGTGTLTVKANYNNGIESNGILKITGGNININSMEDGLIGSDLIAAIGGNINIKASGDGMKSTNNEDSSKGLIVLDGGDFTITAGSDGIQAESTLLISDGEYTINSGGNVNGSTKKSSKDSLDAWGDETTSVSKFSESSSAHGLKADSNITINGGTFAIDSSDDAVLCKDSITINGGSFTINSDNAGIHADTSINITNGLIDIKHSYEGLESSIITVLDGNIHIIAADDGINIAGGNDTSSTKENPDENDTSSTKEEPDENDTFSSKEEPEENTIESPDDNYLTINSGYLYVDAAGDGIDANGSIYMTNGTVIVNGPTDNRSGALVYNKVFQISGGLLIAAGSTGMASAPSGNSTQYSIAYNFTQVQPAEQLFHLEDSEGNTIITFAPKKEYQSVVMSSPDIKKGEAYSIYSGGTSTGSETDGLYTEGN